MTAHTRKKRIKTGAGLAVFVLLAAAAGYFAGRVERALDAAPEGAAEGFDVDRLEVPRAELAVTRPGSGALPAKAPAPPPPASPSAPKPPSATPARAAVGTQKAGEGWAKSSVSFGALLEAPGKFLAKQSYLGKPVAFQQFVSNPMSVRAWLGRPLVRAVTGSPALVKLLVLRPGVVRSFLDSPAMKDPRAIAALGKSPLVKELAQRPGVQAALSDQALVKRALMGPEVMAWLAKHPEGMAAFQQMSSAAGSSTLR